jgi:glycerophosphoryl diester phosphodiesterase
LSSDGELLIFHDPWVNRTTNLASDDEFEAMSFAKLRSLDAGYTFTADDNVTFPYRGLGVQIPTLSEVMWLFLFLLCWLNTFRCFRVADLS